jgi:hypothetical protein
MLVKNKGLTAELSIDLILYFIELFKEFVIGEEKEQRGGRTHRTRVYFMTNGKDFFERHARVEQEHKIVYF